MEQNISDAVKNAKGKSFFVRVNGTLDILLGTEHGVVGKRALRFTYEVIEMPDASIKITSAPWRGRSKPAVYGADVEAAIGLALAKSLRNGDQPEDEDIPPWIKGGG